MRSKNTEEHVADVPLSPSDACCPFHCPHLRLGGNYGFMCAKEKRSMELLYGVPLRLTSCAYQGEGA